METTSLPPITPDPSSIRPTRPFWKRPAFVILSAILTCCLLTAAGTAWWVKRNVYASPLSPVTLSAAEQESLNQKVAQLELAGELHPNLSPGETPATPIDPSIASRTLTLTAKEINAFLANQGVGEQIKVDLSRHRLTAHFLLPIDENAPLLGGLTLRFRLALDALLNPQGKLELKVADIRVGGVPIPNAWLGEIKGLDLITSDIGHDPTVQRFVAGIKEFEIQDGSLHILLNE
jgi:uncharacterized protein YpmS